MRLLNAKTYKLHTVLGKDKPKYAILSHTWEDGEVLYEDAEDMQFLWSMKKGFFKVKNTCDQALRDGCDFVWIDTCNINKDSSSELSEAINSMFKWYRDATICYAYIADIKAGEERSFSKCRWLTRGWTLQEMIAPDRVHFYDKNWTFLGSRISLAEELSRSSGIQKSVLLRRDDTVMSFDQGLLLPIKDKVNCQCCIPTEESDARSMLDRFSVAQKMKWASNRKTTREEDIAYCLMGLFDVNMPLMYGEGTRAFFRLQKAILEMGSDHSILAFRSSSSNLIGVDGANFLAPNPSLFREDVQSIQARAPATNTTLIGTTMSIDMLICPVQVVEFRDLYLGILDCSMNGDPYMVPAILLLSIDEERAMFRCIFKKSNLFRLHSNHPRVATVIVDTGLRPDPMVLIYNAREIKRARITIIGENTVTRARHHAIAHVQVDVSLFLSDLGYKSVSFPPLAAGRLLDTTYRDGIVRFSHEEAEEFSVNWDTGTSGQIRCSISSDRKPEYKAVVQAQMDLHVDPELVSMEKYLTRPYEKLGKSRTIVLNHPGKPSLQVWISMSREVFIGRSRLVLSIRGKTRASGRHRRGMAEPTPQLLEELSQLEDIGEEEAG